MDEEEQSGPVMLVATSMMRPPKTRIGRIGKDFTLPFTIPLINLIALALGALVGLMLALPFGSFQGFAFGAIGGGVAGLAAVTMSPIKGESFAKWLGLSVSNLRAQKVSYNGLPAKVYIGVAPLRSTALGKVHMVAGAAEVLPGSVDERGVFISSEKKLADNRMRAAEFVASRGGSLASLGDSKTLPRQQSRSLEQERKVATQKKKRKEETPSGGQRPSITSSPGNVYPGQTQVEPYPEGYNPWQQMAQREEPSLWGRDDTQNHGENPGRALPPVSSSQNASAPFQGGMPASGMSSKEPETRRSRRASEKGNHLPANSSNKPLTRK